MIEREHSEQQKMPEQGFSRSAQLILCVVIMILLGTYTVFSSTAALDLNTVWYKTYGFKHLVFLAGSVAAGWLASLIPYKKYESIHFRRALLAVLIVLFIAVMFAGPVINGARRWLVFFNTVSIQPSEFAKLASIIFSAAVVSRLLRRKGAFNLIEWYTPGKLRVPFINQAFILPLVLAGLTVMQPDLGTAIIIAAFPFMMTLWGGGIKLIHWGVSLIGIALGYFFFVYNVPYRQARLDVFLDPWAHAQDGGYQTVQSILAVASGGFFGEGLFQGSSKYFYLPEAHTDFAFAVFAQETGFVGSVFLLVVVLAFMFVTFQITLHSPDYFGMFVAMGINFMITGQAVYNMLMICGGALVTGIPLPFFSYGGSSLMTNCIAIGILVNIARAGQQKKVPLRRGKPAKSIREDVRVNGL